MKGRLFYVVQGGLAGFFFGTSAIFIRFLPSMDSFTIGFYRLALATIFLTVPSIFLIRRTLLETLKLKGVRALLLGIIIGGHFAMYISSVKLTTVMNATVLTNTTPIFASLLSLLFYKVKPSSRVSLGILVSLIGMFVIFLGARSGGASMVGDLQAVLAALLWAIYLVFGRNVRIGSNPIAVMIPIYLSSSLLLCTSSFFLGNLRPPSSTEIPAIFGLAVFPTALGHTLSFSSLKGLQPYQTAILSFLEPVVASILAIPLFGETPSSNALLGSLLIFAGIYLVVSVER
ncbi:MAG: DMT family transporter [Aigarchaeota archaeon]|nr:DMT family transporter [Aigarchaeota archaeon]MCX8192321.1 DMT family transporter [Nitrososphaeria archaeon]MDW7986845.1 EamA family transporter [Nitrososphaerota archaeon]